MFEYVKNMTLNLGIGEASSWEVISQNSAYLNETARLNLAFHQWFTKGMRMIRYKVGGIVDHDHKKASTSGTTEYIFL